MPVKKKTKTKTKAQTKATPVQKFISESLDDIGMTRYELAQQCGYKPDSVYRKLRTPTLTTTVERMLAALGASITISGQTMKLSLIRGRVRAVIT